jgi:hypothetical protein
MASIAIEPQHAIHAACVEVDGPARELLSAHRVSAAGHRDHAIPRARVAQRLGQLGDGRGAHHLGNRGAIEPRVDVVQDRAP